MLAREGPTVVSISLAANAPWNDNIPPGKNGVLPHGNILFLGHLGQTSRLLAPSQSGKA